MKLLHGDCLELLKSIPDKSVDMVLCDLPYGTTQNKWDNVIPFEPLWEQYKRVIKINAPVVLFSQMPFTIDVVNSNRSMFRYEWIWKKTRSGGFLNANRMPLQAHENVLVFYSKLPNYIPQMGVGKPYTKKAVTNGDGNNYGKFERSGTVQNNNGTRYPTSVIECANGNNRSIHPTQKPVPLLEYLIKTYTNEGETVLDNCMGSGSTGVACVNTGRDFIGMELDSNYYDIACERIRKAQENKEADERQLRSI